MVNGRVVEMDHHQFVPMRTFAWQEGYGAFSVSRSNFPAVVDYTTRQREHHQKEAFEDEYERLMKLHEVDYDRAYLSG